MGYTNGKGQKPEKSSRNTYTREGLRRPQLGLPSTEANPPMPPVKKPKENKGESDA